MYDKTAASLQVLHFFSLCWEFHHIFQISVYSYNWNIDLDLPVISVSSFTFCKLRINIKKRRTFSPYVILFRPFGLLPKGPSWS